MLHSRQASVGLNVRQASWIESPLIRDPWFWTVLALSALLGTAGVFGFAFRLGEIEYWISTVQLWYRGELGAPLAYFRPGFLLAGVAWLEFSPRNTLSIELFFSALMWGVAPLIYAAVRPYSRTLAAGAGVVCALFVHFRMFAAIYGSEAMSVPALALAIFAAEKYLRSPRLCSFILLVAAIFFCGFIRVAFIWLPFALIPAVGWRAGRRQALVAVVFVALNWGLHKGLDRAFGLVPFSNPSIILNSVLIRGLVKPENGPATRSFFRKTLENLSADPVTEGEESSFWRALDPHVESKSFRTYALFSVIVSSSDNSKLSIGDYFAVLWETVAAHPRHFIASVRWHARSFHQLIPADKELPHLFVGRGNRVLEDRKSKASMTPYEIPWLSHGVGSRFRQTVFEPTYSMLRDPRIYGPIADPFFEDRPRQGILDLLRMLTRLLHPVSQALVWMGAYGWLLVLPLLVLYGHRSPAASMLVLCSAVIWFNVVIGFSMGTHPRYAAGLFPVYVTAAAFFLINARDLRGLLSKGRESAVT